MNVTIIGTGNIARGIGTRALAGGHAVALVGREAGKAEALAAELQPAARDGAAVRAAAPDAPLDGDLVVLAVPYPAAAPIVAEYGDRLAGKVVVDVTNPIDFATMSPAVPADTSAAEEIAEAAPASATVVKAFNTTFAGTLVAGRVAGQPLDVLIAGDDAPAKAVVAQLARDGGLNPIDVGPLARARQLEALAFLGITLQSTLDTGFRTAWKLLLPRQP